MVSPPHSYPSPTQAQISDGTHPFYAPAPQQQQHAPQAVMDPQHRPREHSMPSNQGAEDYASRPVAVHPQPYNNNLGNPEYPMQQMQPQVTQQSPQVDPSGTPLSKRPKTSRACDQCRSKKVSNFDILKSHLTERYCPFLIAAKHLEIQSCFLSNFSLFRHDVKSARSAS